jgi:hypothetical protein
MWKRLAVVFSRSAVHLSQSASMGEVDGRGESRWVCGWEGGWARDTGTVQYRYRA